MYDLRKVISIYSPKFQKSQLMNKTSIPISTFCDIYQLFTADTLLILAYACVNKVI